MAAALVNTMTGEKVISHLPIDEIVLGDRHRKELGDIPGLAASIKSVGLLNPITVTDKNQLVAGHRRLEACRSLGVAEVPVRIVRSIDSAVKALVAERDENTCRKDMTPVELKSLTDSLLEIERPAAKERQAAAGSANLPGASGGRPPTTSDDKGKAADKAAGAAGWSRRSYQRTTRVLEAAHDETLPSSVRDVAAALAARLEEGTISPNEADQILKEAIAAATPAEPPAPTPGPKTKASIEAKIAKAKEMAAAGYTSRQIGEAIGIGAIGVWIKKHGIEVPADAVTGNTRRIDSNRVVTETVGVLEGLAMGVGLVELGHLDRTQVEQWATSLSNSLRSLNRLAKQLKEMAP